MAFGIREKGMEVIDTNAFSLILLNIALLLGVWDSDFCHHAIQPWALKSN